jgi:peptide/nickel transport system permease protein
MTAHILRRIALIVPVLLGVTLLLFALMELVPGDAAEAMLGPYATPENVARLRASMDLDAPLPARYAAWLGNLLRLDLGTAHSIDRPVRDEVMERFSATLILASAAFAVCLAAGLGAGILLATRGNTPAGRLLDLATVAGISLPSFWLGLVLVSFFSVGLGWFPVGGMRSPFSTAPLPDILHHLVLPATTLGIVAAAVTARLARTAMLDALGRGHIRTARSKGLRHTAVVLRHALPNALVTLLPVLGLQAGYVLGGAIYIETVFQWPGIGRMLVQAIQTRDLLLVQGGVLVLGVSYLLVNLLADILQTVLDPRLRR